MKQIRNQITQAKAFGGMTGLGTQNMMQIGAAGAQAVQGTPMSAAGGAGMYQYATGAVSNMMQGSPGMSGAVQRAGAVRW